MKEELKKSLRTYGALLLLGVTGVPLGAAAVSYTHLRAHET